MSFLSHAILALTKDHLFGPEANLKGYFLPINRKKIWIRYPFSVNVESETNLSDLNVELFTELLCNTLLNNILRIMLLIDFWFSYCQSIQL